MAKAQPIDEAKAVNPFIVMAGIAAALPFIGIGALYVGQRQFIYPGAKLNAEKMKASADYQHIETTTEDGLTLQALYHPAAKGKPTILFFHGNGETIAGSKGAIEHLIRQGYGALLAEYRGYSGNPGTPSEDGLYHDGEAAWAWLRANKVKAQDIVVIGYSLGTGVASKVAADHDCRGLMLVAPFKSLPETAAQSFWWMPTDMLMHDRFATFERINEVNAPVLLIHGADDDIVHAAHSIALKKERPSAKLVMLKDQDHFVIYSTEAQAAMSQWIAKL